MSKHVLHNASVTLSSVDISDYVESVELNAGVGTAGITAMQDGWEDVIPNGVKRWSLRLNLFQDYAAGTVYTIMYNLIHATNTSIHTLAVRPTTSTQSATNPTFTGYVALDGDVPLLGGAVGDAHKFSVSLKGAGTLSFMTSTTS
uniref:Tail protein n=1 Tax=viral metagenome TaxID=1070528 RepID=A0A6M3LP40_9ZZZZ